MPKLFVVVCLCSEETVVLWKSRWFIFLSRKKGRILLFLKFLNGYSTKIDTIPVDTGAGLVCRSVCVSLGRRAGLPGAGALLGRIRACSEPRCNSPDWCELVL